MGKRSRRSRASSVARPAKAGQGGRFSTRSWLAPGLVVLGALVATALVVLLMLRGSPAAVAGPISSVSTDDVHSLAFLGSSERVLLGHHAGILESNDGGATWTSWGSGSDAMALGVAGDQPIVVAGHDVLALGSPDGRWQDIANDLPNTDIHGFARDPRDPNRMWAYLAAGGLYGSTDAGAHWSEAFGGHALGLFAIARPDTTRLIAVDPERGSIVASDDGGRTWQDIGTPPSTPVYAMAGANGGDTILLSGSEGLFRSDDGGATFGAVLDVGQPILAIAAITDGETIVVATRDRLIYRSDDGGRSWPPG